MTQTAEKPDFSRFTFEELREYQRVRSNPPEFRRQAGIELAARLRAKEAKP